MPRRAPPGCRMRTAGDGGRLAARTREAEPAGASLRGQLLIASPEIGDPRFQRSVILMVRHDADGALGIMINRPFDERTVASLLAAIGKPDDTVEGSIKIFA